MSERVLVINASPRKGGNDDLLCEALVKGAKEKGKQVKKMNVTDYRINPCYACGYCIEHPGKCAQKDDWGKIYEMLEWCDAVVFSSPLYYGSVSAWLKIIFDRFYMQRLAPIMEKKKAGFMCVSAVKSEKVIKVAYDCFHAWTACFENLKEGGTVLALGFGGKGEIKDSIYIQKAEQLGREI